MPPDPLFAEPPALKESEALASPDPRIARAEERIGILRELAELGMDLTRALVRRHAPAPDTPETPETTLDSPAPPAPLATSASRRDPAEAFTRLSRAVRLTLALETTTDDAIAALRAGASRVAGPHGAVASGRAQATPEPPRSSLGQIEALAPVERYKAHIERFLDKYAEADEAVTFANAQPVPRDFPSERQNQIRDHVVDVINHEVESGDRAHELLDELYERLWEGERYDHCTRLPLKIAVAVICEDLGLSPLWSDATEDGWPPPAPSGHSWETTWRPMGSMKPKPRLYRQGREARGPPNAASP